MPRCTGSMRTQRSRPSRRRFPARRRAAGSTAPSSARRCCWRRSGSPSWRRSCIPLVRASERAFLQAEAARGTKIAVLEIPLLFETGADQLVDATIVVSATPELQRERLMKRDNLTREKLERLLARQMPDAEKAQARRFRRGYQRRGERQPGAARCDSCATAASARARPSSATGLEVLPDLKCRAIHGSRYACARSSSTPRPPASTPRAATA